MTIRESIISTLSHYLRLPLMSKVPNRLILSGIFSSTKFVWIIYISNFAIMWHIYDWTNVYFDINFLYFQFNYSINEQCCSLLCQIFQDLYKLFKNVRFFFLTSMVPIFKISLIGFIWGSIWGSILSKWNSSQLSSRRRDWLL